MSARPIVLRTLGNGSIAFKHRILFLSIHPNYTDIDKVVTFLTEQLDTVDFTAIKPLYPVMTPVVGFLACHETFQYKSPHKHCFYLDVVSGKDETLDSEGRSFTEFVHILRHLNLDPTWYIRQMICRPFGAEDECEFVMAVFCDLESLNDIHNGVSYLEEMLQFEHTHLLHSCQTMLNGKVVYQDKVECCFPKQGDLT